MYKGYFTSLLFFVLGYICILTLDGGKQFAMGSIALVTSTVIAGVTFFIYNVEN